MLEEFLNAKPLFYDTIDYDRMPRIYARIAHHFVLPKIIHLVGTNGKGTTGRFLATALLRQNKRVGHYTSPHICSFNERIWLGGRDVPMEQLDQIHLQLLALLKPQEKEALSYFEYTTLLAMLLYSKEKCDYVVLEAGLGGEHDATAVFGSDLTLITPIAKDHEAFLGETLREIATTKSQAIDKAAIIAKQKDPLVIEIAQSIAKEKGARFYKAEDLLSDTETMIAADVAEKEKLPEYLCDNLLHAMAALHYLGEDFKAADFYGARLFGRMTPIASNIIVDVGHNPLAATALKKALRGRKFSLVYNSYRDKEYKKILFLLSPLIVEVLVIDIEGSRAEERTKLIAVLDELGLDHSDFTKVEADKEYLVFGSFSVVDAFLKVYNG